MPIDPETAVYNLTKKEPSIIAVAVLKDKNIIYTTDNWDISGDLGRVISSWDSMNAQFIMISGVKYSMLQCTSERLTATSIRGEGHIVGAKDEEHAILAYVEPDGDMRSAYPETARALATLSSRSSYIAENTQLGTKTAQIGGASSGAGAGASVDPQLKSEIQAFLNWIKDSEGLSGYIKYYLQQNNTQIISELSKIYAELRQIFNV
ncbi:MAG: hypothetical protein ACTSRI_16690 [Promethearchaeota archaeon]